jgi:hypothetical protein
VNLAQIAVFVGLAITAAGVFGVVIDPPKKYITMIPIRDVTRPDSAYQDANGLPMFSAAGRLEHAATDVWREMFNGRLSGREPDVWVSDDPKDRTASIGLLLRGDDGAISARQFAEALNARLTQPYDLHIMVVNMQDSYPDHNSYVYGVTYNGNAVTHYHFGETWGEMQTPELKVVQ